MAFSARADHITGGAISYSLKSVSANLYTYTVTIKMYMVCHSYREFYNPTYLSVFDKKTNARIKDVLVPLTRTEVIELTGNDYCIANPPEVCHKIGYYVVDLVLPAAINGYVLSSEVFFRVANMKNLTQGYEFVGATYTAEIPGTFVLGSGPKNSSATYVGNDLVIICAGNPFTYSFAAEDKDGDELTYSLCDAYKSDNYRFGIDLLPPAPPPYLPVTYNGGFTSSRPLGSQVGIDAKTGLISGIAPEPGTYVITVCVDEKRDGKFIATQRKDLQLNVAACSFTSAQLPASYLLCGDSSTVRLENLSFSSLVQSYKWRITNNAGVEIFSTDSPTPSYTFTDTGLYNVRLDVNQNAKCADSASSQIKVYPGFKPGFGYSGICINKSTQFTDSTSSVYGTINSWHWNFMGDSLAVNISSNLQNPVNLYLSPGEKNISLRVTDSKGCVDSITKTITIFDKPPIQLAFRDTLICKPDTLQLHASGTGDYKWTPLTDLNNPDIGNPLITPTNSTTYYVDLTVDGCTNRDSVMVRVVDHVTLSLMHDTTICSGDSVQLHITSDGLNYHWLPLSGINNDSLQQPVVLTQANTTYSVNANIGHCNASGKVTVKPVAYPVALAGADTLICFGSGAMLNGTGNGVSYQWYPDNNISDFHALHTAAYPQVTTTYTLFAYDSKGCPKPGLDSVIVKVDPRIVPFAGHDTSIVINQPLQLHASGGKSYKWSPSFGLSSADIADPVALFNEPSANNRYKLLAMDEVGCVDSAFINIKVYKTLPTVFVPSGFTPNGDGHNDILRPILAGIQRIDVFNIYNRWGQIIFSASGTAKGWDGSANGNLQPSGSYVWIVKAVDYNGVAYFSKGTVTLIR